MLTSRFAERELDDRRYFQLVATLDGTFIGQVGMYIDEPEHKRAEIWYLLTRTSRNQGLATEAVDGLVTFAFEQVRLHRLWATSHPSNKASHRVLEKCGFELEGRIRDYKFVHGEWRDSLLFSKIAP